VPFLPPALPLQQQQLLLLLLLLLFDERFVPFSPLGRESCFGSCSF